MKALSLLLAAMAVVSLTSSAFAQSDSAPSSVEVGGESTATAPTPESTASVTVDPFIVNNVYLAPIVGPTLTPSSHQFEAFLGASAGTFVTHSSSSSTNLTTEELQLAYGIGGGFYVSALAEYYSLNSTDQYSSETSNGFVEPEIALGYSRQLSESNKIKVQLAYAINSGAQTTSDTWNQSSTNASFGGSSSNVVRGGSAFIPSVEFDTTALLHTNSGARVSYFIAGDSTRFGTDTQNVDGEGSSVSNELVKTTGGNVTVASLFSQQRLSDRVSLGETLSMAWQEGSTVSYDGMSGWTSPGSNMGVVSINVPIKLGKSIAVIPEVDYLRALSQGADEGNINAGVNGKFSF